MNAAIFKCSLLVLTGVSLCGARAIGDEENAKSCGYQSCHEVDPARLNVHLVPHSHDDVGWLKTVDQYYYGSRSGIQRAGVQYIIGSVVDALRANPDRRFIQVETAFFWQWWQRQSPYLQNEVKKLVDSGRLEMVNGAWSMNDEAAAHYQSIIDQFTLGLRTINDTVGECGQPKIGWQIDPFGHSKEQASLFTQLGYEALFFARLDYRDSRKRHDTQNLELLWQGSKSLGNASNIFTGVLYDFYTTPAYFCWDVLCSDTPINDDEESPDFNQDEITENFAKYVIRGAKFFKTNNILITMGGDFTYQAADMFYSNMDKLIDGFKKFRPDINILYSTPSCYVKAVNDASKNVTYELKTDDFFPYASGEHSYWTGYYTSRPNSKRFERTANNLLQSTKQLFAFERTLKGKDFSKNNTLLMQTMGVMQHHDAITGTEKQHVVDDYVRLITKSIRKAESNISEVIRDLLGQSEELDSLRFSSCVMANMTKCAPSENSDSFVVALYNPLSRKVAHFVRLPVAADGSYRVTKVGDTVPVLHNLVQPLTNFTDGNNNVVKQELVFRADGVPAMGLQLYQVEKMDEKAEESAAKDAAGGEKTAEKAEETIGGNAVGKTGEKVNEKVEKEPEEKTGENSEEKAEENSGEKVEEKVVEKVEENAEGKTVEKTEGTTQEENGVQRDEAQEGETKTLTFEKDQIGISIDQRTGMLTSVTINDITVRVKQEFLYYNGFRGSNYGEPKRSSGAYIFRPAESTPKALPITDRAKIVKTVVGELVLEVHQEFNGWVKQVIRLHKDEGYVEFDWIVGPLNVSSYKGVEVVSRFTTDLKNGGVFYTDANGRQMVERRRNHRATYDYTDEEPVSGNYYPVTSRISIVDEQRNVELSVLNDRAQGGSSLLDGEIELMVHRRLLNDDAFGVEEALNEREFQDGVKVRGQHYLVFADLKASKAKQRDLAQRKLLQPWMFVSPGNALKATTGSFAGLNRDLPKNVQILTLEPWRGNNELLLRLEHLFEVGEDEELSQAVKVDLKDLFAGFKVVGIKETTLGANQWIEDNTRLTWNFEERNTKVEKIEDLVISLNPMDIRTFIIKTTTN